jgi:hypothetical protein
MITKPAMCGSRPGSSPRLLSAPGRLRDLGLTGIWQLWNGPSVIVRVPRRGWPWTPTLGGEAEHLHLPRRRTDRNEAVRFCDSRFVRYDVGVNAASEASATSSASCGVDC